MSDYSADGIWQRVLGLADEYLQRRRAGERPSIENFTQSHPDFADQTNRFLPVLQLLADASDTALTVDLNPSAPRGLSQPKSLKLTVPCQFGRYLVERLLGQGAMGAVYLARDSQLDREVALKIPHFGEEDSGVVERFYREARAMATVQHSNLCPVYDVGEIEGVHFLSMAFIEGVPLADTIGERKAWPDLEAARLVRKLALALEAAHRAGIVHRDLKPANVMINAAGEPIVMDFGLARRDHENEETLTREGTIIGSPAYMAPEQVESKADLIGPQTDIYALGVILYELMCGQRPFLGTTLQVLRDITWSSPPRPTMIRSDIVPALEAVCLKCMEKQLNDRFSSASELADELERILAGDTVDGGESPPSTIEVSSAGNQSAAATVAFSASHVSEIREGTTLRRKAPLAVLLTVVVAGAIVAAYVSRPEQRVESAPVMPAAGKSAPDEPADELVETPVPDGIPDVPYLLPRSPVPTSRSTGKLYKSDMTLGTEDTHRVSLADLDGDGDLDAFLINRRFANQVWLNDGQGNFEDSGQNLETPDSTSAAIGDVDGDHDLDIVVAAPETNAIWVNDGHAGFSRGPSIVSRDGRITSAIGLEDFDGDGDLDAFLVNKGAPDEIRFSDGHGGFNETGQELGGNLHGVDVALGDLDGDGDPDAFVANGKDPDWLDKSGTDKATPDVVWFNDGTGTFTQGTQSLTPTESISARLSDADGDGDLDVFVGGHRSSKSNTTSLWINDGRGTFSQLSLARACVYGGGFFLPGDLDGDGRTDAVLGRLCVSSFVVWNNRQLMTETHGDWIGWGVCSGAALGDLDGDGDLDAIFVDSRDTELSQVWLNRNLDEPAAEPLFVMSDQKISSERTDKGAVLGDLDQDGDLDIYFSIRGRDLIWKNDGTGNFEKTSNRPGKSRAQGAALGDVDGDGDLDVFRVCPDNQPDEVWLNDGTGVFTDSGQMLGAENSFGVTLADFDGDDDLDAFVVTFGDQKDLVWINEGNGRFVRGQQVPGNQSVYAISVDIDRDNDQDVIVSGWSTFETRIWLNDGQAQFTQRPPIRNRGGATFSSAADLNDDGFLDLALTAYGERSQVFFGDESGNFQPGRQDFTNSFGAWNLLVDLDNDGDRDLVQGNNVMLNADQILLNDGRGHFEHRQWLGNFYTRSLSAGDLDGDGDLDLFSGNDSPPSVIWLNQTIK